jgi:hypothetical protein
MKSKIICTNSKKNLNNKKKFSVLLSVLVMLLISISMWQCRKEEILVVNPEVISTNQISNSTGTEVKSNSSAIFSNEMDAYSFS